MTIFKMKLFLRSKLRPPLKGEGPVPFLDETNKFPRSIRVTGP
jgi:hypothetical protein